MSLLVVEDVTVRFGGIVALDGASFTIDEGQICGLIGPNGAGKTTLFNVISRIYSADKGSVTFDGTDVLAMAPHRICTIGVYRTFQNLALWPGMSVLENVMVGSHPEAKQNFFTAPLRLGLSREEKRLKEKAWQALDELDLTHVAHHPAAGLPFGTLKRIELARALVGRPRLLMLDEPASGLTHQEVDHLADIIAGLRDRHNLTVLLVEHHMAMVMRISEKIVVLNFGRKIAEGDPDAVRNDPGVIEAYLGELSVSIVDDSTPSGDAGAADLLLEVTDLHAAYGPVEVLRGISFRVPEGDVVVILGANGAGKTTTLRGLCGGLGYFKPKGKVLLNGQDITTTDTAEIVRRGMAHVPQGRGTFPELTVEDNLAAGAYIRDDPDGVKEDTDRFCELFPVLGERRRQPAGSLSGGEQQMLAVARALMSKPTLLLLDEPSLGLAPLVIQGLFSAFKDLNDERGTTMLLVEQNANLALEIASYGYVLEAGKIVLEGSSDELRADPAVQEAYLGA